MFDPIRLKLKADPLILSALSEDITTEDVSTNSVMPSGQIGKVSLLCKENGVICGLGIFQRVFFLLDSEIQVHCFVQDGDDVQSGQILAEIQGDIRTLLSGERTALNYLQRMSGIATYTREVTSLLEGSSITLLDSRKTTPNNRIFEKYATKIGGARNHRYNLSDGILLKDNHIDAAGGVEKAVQAAKKYAHSVQKIEVEVENLTMVSEAIKAKADIIMLDNMSYDQIQEAIQLIDAQAEIEISGNITKENIQALKGLKADYISSGAITHSAPILDMSLKHLQIVDP